MENEYNGIVIFGEMGAGKDALAQQFIALRANVKIYNIGVLCRRMMKVSIVNPTWRGRERVIGQSVADDFRRMDKYIMCDYILACIYEPWQKKFGFDNSNLEGEDYNKALLQQLLVIRNHELSVIVGGRTKDDFNYWSDKKYLTVGVKTDDEIKKKRLVSRDGEKIVKNSSSSHNTEIDASYIVNNLCDEIIINNGTLEHLKISANELLTKYNL